MFFSVLPYSSKINTNNLYKIFSVLFTLLLFASKRGLIKNLS